MEKIIKRTIQAEVEKKLFKGKLIVIYGARQVGKTTLVKTIQNKTQESIYLNCDEPDIRAALTNTTSTAIKSLIGSARLVIIDEAQRVRNIGLTLKLMVDTFNDTQIIATGSSSFDLSNEIAEPLTGRKYEFHLYSFSFEELSQIYQPTELHRIVEQRMIYGMYPEITLKEQEANELLKSLTQSYVYKDVLEYQRIKNPDILQKLLEALALQVGQEVSYNELANLINIDKKTISSYIQLLEQAFIIFRLRPYSRNSRKELTKLRKIYFYDTGIRNALINNLNPLRLRADKGALWENFLIAERMKANHNHNISPNTYFWRTHHQQEIDYLEEINNNLSGYEFKWQKNKLHIPRAFSKIYPDTEVKLVNRQNFVEFIIP